MGLEDFSEEQLEAMLTAKRVKRERDEAEALRRRLSGPQQLVPNSPSPRKKPRTDNPASSSSARLGARPAPPSFFDRPAGDRTLGGNDGKVELLSRPKEGKFSSHESAVPKAFAERLAEDKAVEAARRKRQEQKPERSSGFNSLSRDGRSVLLEGKSGAVPLFDREKRRAKEEKPRVDGKGKGKERAREEDETNSLLLRAAASGSGGGGIGRPANRPTPSASALVKEKEEERTLTRRRREEEKEDELDILDGPKKRSRNKDGTVIEEIEMGPREFKPRIDDLDWEKVEPYSGIKLKQRILPHSTVDNLLDGRYHLTPSQIYSLARIDSRQRIDVDPETVDSDWVVIGVLAQKGEVRFLNSNPYGGKPPSEEKLKADAGDDEDEDDDEDEEEAEKSGSKGKGKGKGKKGGGGQYGRDELYAAPSRRKRQQKYLRFDLIDFSSSRASQSGAGRLGVMLVEADSVDKAIDDDGNEQNVYKGQSGGAYEKFWKETPGAVVAIMNPTFLPYNPKFPTYTLKPTSADSMVVIGRADHLVFCDAQSKDGKPCGSWVDDRTGKFCEYHIKRALQRTAGSRPETYANTASMGKQGEINLSQLKKSFAGSSKPLAGRNGLMVLGGSGASSSSSVKREPGLPPSIPAVVYGTTVHVTSGTRNSSVLMRASNVLSAGDMTSSRNGGHFIPGVREGPSVSEEKKRLLRQAQGDRLARKELKELVGRDKGKTNGGEMVHLAGLAIGKAKAKAAAAGGGKGKGKEKKGKEASSDVEAGEGENGEEEKKAKRRSILSGAAARRIGFDPTAKYGEVDRDQSSEAKEFRSLLASGLTNAEREFNLAAPPGAAIRSVGVPGGKHLKKKRASSSPAVAPSAAVEVEMEDDLEIEGDPGGRPKISRADLADLANPA